MMAQCGLRWALLCGQVVDGGKLVLNSALWARDCQGLKQEGCWVSTTAVDSAQDVPGGLLEAVTAWLAEHEREVTAWREHLHSYPETSHNEVETTAFIAKVLRHHGLEPVLFPATGLYVDIDDLHSVNDAASDGTEHDDAAGLPKPGALRVAFRADIDALPIAENTGLPFASKNPGVMHACGHDVHAAVLLGFACAVADAVKQGVALPQGIRCIFQPAEEVMDGGAPSVISWGALSGVSTIFALHVEPKLAVGRIGIREGAITSAADVINIEVVGPGGHTSRPHRSADVVYALSRVVTELPAVLSRRIDPRSGTVMVFGAIQAGAAANAIPKRGVAKGTIRTADIAVWNMVEPLLRELIGDIVRPTGCDVIVNYQRGVPPVVNDAVVTVVCADAVRAIDSEAVVQAPQSSGGEDFSWYLQHIPGAMVRLGAWNGQGKRSDLHQEDMMVDPRAVGIGIKFFASVLDRLFG